MDVHGRSSHLQVVDYLLVELLSQLLFYSLLRVKHLGCQPLQVLWQILCADLVVNKISALPHVTSI